MHEPQDDLFAHDDEITGLAHAEYQALRQALADRVIGRSELLDRLALVALVHRRGFAPQRLLLCGPPGTGKTHLAIALAESTGSPHYTADCTTLVEAGFAGATITDYLAGWAAREGGPEKIARGVLILDEIDKLRLPPGPDAHSTSIAHALGRQSALLALLGVGTPLRLSAAANMQLDPAGLLVACCGSFAVAPWSAHRAPTTEDLTAFGLIPEIADRLSLRLHLPPPDEHELICRFRTETGAAALTYTRLAAELGFRLSIADATYTLAARDTIRAGGGLREGSARVSEAAARVLATALREGLAPGSALTVTPDDLAPVRSPTHRSR